MIDIIILAAILSGVLASMLALFWLTGRIHSHCLHTIPGEEGLMDEDHGRFTRTVRMQECCICPARFPGEVVGEGWSR